VVQNTGGCFCRFHENENVPYYPFEDDTTRKLKGLGIIVQEGNCCDFIAFVRGLSSKSRGELETLDDHNLLGLCGNCVALRRGSDECNFKRG
jgi:hypothetical protein